MAKYVAAIDQGTTSTRCMIFNHSGKVVGSAPDGTRADLPQARLGRARSHGDLGPHPGCHQGRLAEAPGSSPADIAAVGVTNQRETTVVWDKNDGQAVLTTPSSGRTPAPTRSATRLAADGGQDRFRAKVGLPLATYFSGPKVNWMLDNVDGVRAAAEKGEPLFGNIDTWVIWNLTGGVTAAPTSPT